MAQIELGSTRSEFFTGLVEKVATTAVALSNRWTRWRDRKILAGLTAEQLADCGIDPDEIRPARPVLECEPGLTTRLMSMR